jgi:putative transport protein
LKRNGLRLNVVAAVIVLSGSALAIMLGWLFGLDPAATLGILSGATTNTPSLGAAQQALASLPDIPDPRQALPALAYAVTYPVAIAGIIGTLLALKALFRIDMRNEVEAFSSDQRPVCGDNLRLANGPSREQASARTVMERTIAVTRRNVLGKTIGELALDPGGVTVTRITRADIALVAATDLPLQFGDMVQVLGDEQSVKQAETLLGNDVSEISQAQFIPLSIGIAAGIIVGTMPIVVPGLPQSVQLGLAGGPLVVALGLGQLGRIGRLVFYMPVSTNLAFREFGIALFFAAVGLAAGPTFFATAFSVTGLLWLGAGVCVTVLPLLLTGIFARSVLRMNFATLGGLLAGSVTDPPALMFVTHLAKSDAPTLAYVTVYPMTTLLRVLAAQALALTLIH